MKKKSKGRRFFSSPRFKLLGEERDGAEESLRGSEERLAGIVGTAPIGIAFVDTGGRVTYANAAAE